jgi:hypothetical protein
MRSPVFQTLVAAGLSALVVLAGAPVFAGTPFRVNDYTTGQQVLPTLAVEPDGDFLVVWASEAQDGSGFGLFAQRFDAAGARRGGEFAVNQQTLGDQLGPSVAVGSDGDFVAVWQSGSGAVPGSIRGRRFDGMGDPVGDEFLVNTPTTAVQSEPRVARAGDGRFVVAWTGQGADGDDSGIVARLFDAQGDPVGPEFVVNTETYAYQNSPDVGADAAGNFVVVWRRYDYYANVLAGQRLDAAGAQLGTEFTVSGTDFVHLSPSVSVSPTGGFAVAWTAWNFQTSGNEMFARPYDASGNPGPRVQLNTYKAGNQGGYLARAGLVAQGAQGDFVVTWTGDFMGSADGAVFAKRSTDIGVRRDARISGEGAGSTWFPVVGMDSTGAYVVSWSGQDDSGFGIFARVMPPAPLIRGQVTATDGR